MIPLLSDNKILENQNVQLIISVWEIPFKRILTEVRTQKHFCPLLSWSIESLEKALDQRLLVFSDGKVVNYKMCIRDRFRVMIKVLFVCHGSILKSPGKARKINGFKTGKGAYYTTTDVYKRQDKLYIKF